MKNILLISFVLSVFTGLAQIEPTKSEALMNIKVVNYSHEPRKGEVVILESIKTKKEYRAVTDVNGTCNILVPKGATYNVVYKNFSDTVNYSEIEIPMDEDFVTYDLTLQYEAPKTYTLRNVLFDSGQATLKASSYPALNDLVEVLKLKNTMQIEIAGHTDDVGNAQLNMKLSQARANKVKDYLVKKGIQAARITAKGYGDTKPVADNWSEEGRQKNRRTEVIIIKE